MAGPFTVDASVFLNAFNPEEVGHDVNLRLLTRLRDEAIPMIAPTLLLPEVAGAISRGRRDARLALQFAQTLSRLANLVLVAVDGRLAERAVDVAARHRLRGSDAVYAAVALRFGSTLVTLDEEQRRRVARVLPTRTPGEVLK